MIGYDILDKMDEPRMEGKAHKAPNVYRFNLEKYNNALQNGLKEGRQIRMAGRPAVYQN